MVAMQEKIADAKIAEQLNAIYEAAHVDQEYIDKNGFVKKVDNKEIDIIRIEIGNIEDANDKIYLIERVYRYLSIVNYALSIIEDPELGKRVRVSKSTLTKQQRELEDLRELVLKHQFVLRNMVSISNILQDTKVKTEYRYNSSWIITYIYFHTVKENYMDGEIIQQPKVAMGYDLTKFYGMMRKGFPSSII